ncbi:MAG TPA: nucleoside hydrolase [Terracidiphilus sp.]|nr:nucleoside hydrolase [Terracidiphilus sp.]
MATMKYMQAIRPAGVLLGLAGLIGLIGIRGAYGQLQSKAMVDAPQLVVLDTDIGDDIDDAFALALVLQSPELKLLGVTTTFGNTELRARLLERYLTAAGRADVPIAAGPETAAKNVFTQKAYAERAPHLQFADGVDFLLGQIRAHPGEITLIAIGPLSTVQAAIARDPETFKKLKRVVLMGGSIDRGYDGPANGSGAGERRPPDAEWNFLCDPAGAQALLASGVPVFILPLDSTQVHLPLGDQEEIFAHGSPLTDQLTLLYHQWAGAGGNDGPAAVTKLPTPTLYDPVAVTYTFRPDLCPATPMRIEVDDKGFSRQVPGPPNAQVCLHADEKGFLDLLVSRLTGSD